MLDVEERALSPQERELREFERKRKRALKEKEFQDDFKDEEATLARDPDAEQTFSGKPIKRHRTLKAHGYTTSGAEKYLEIMLQRASFAQVAKLFNDLIHLPFAAHIDAAHTAGRPANSERNAAHNHEDGQHVYNTEMVTAATARKLALESEIIHEKLAAMEAIECPKQRDRVEDEVETLADKFQMILHPKTGRYVHNAARVVEIDSEYRRQGLVCNAEVCVFHIKADIASSRGVKRSIADVYNQDPAEVQLNQSESVIEAPRPVLPAHMNFTHS